jgi:hypothetical protein
MQIPIAHGNYADGLAADFRTSLPRNMVPVPKETGISSGYLRPADGIEKLGDGPGADRGGINWNGTLYRVMGNRLVSVSAAGVCTDIGYVDGTGQVTMDYSFDRLGIAAGGSLYYWDGTTLSRVTDPDLGVVKDMKWIAGYFLTTDGVDLITTDLNDPASVQTTHYGSAEADPDPVNAVDELRNEAYAFGRYTVEVYQNVGGTGFPFQRVEGAQVCKGIIGTHAYCGLGDTFMFLGSGRGEAPAVYQMVPGNVQKVSTREVDTILLGYTEAQLSTVVMESRVDRNHQHVFVHLPDRTLVYDTIGSQVAGEPLWHTVDSGIETPAAYRARGIVWCYDQWNVGDPTGTAVGRFTSSVSSHYGDVIGWDFGTPIVYAGGNSGIVHELELVCLSGRVAVDADPVIWTSYSLDGVTWSMERAARAGRRGQRSKRIAWRGQGQLRHWRVQRFRGTSDAHLAVARLEAQIETLFTRPGVGGNG